MNNYIITVTRQFGSLGRPIAKKLAEALGVAYYDRDIVDMTAKKLGVPLSVIGELEEAVQGRFFRMKYPLGMGTTDTQDTIFRTQRKIIRELAEEGPCVIVGRCADSILQEYPKCIHVFIYAPYEKRYETCLKEFHLQPDEAKKMILEVDKARERYHKAYAGYLPGDYRYKNIMIDSSVLGTEGTVKLLKSFVEEHFCTP